MRRIENPFFSILAVKGVPSVQNQDARDETLPLEAETQPQTKLPAPLAVKSQVISNRYQVKRGQHRAFMIQIKL